MFKKKAKGNAKDGPKSGVFIAADPATVEYENMPCQLKLTATDLSGRRHCLLAYEPGDLPNRAMMPNALECSSKANTEVVLAELTLVLGGARSGKSRFAEHLVLSCDKKPIYLATAEAFDDEMRMRIQLHCERRDTRWSNYEAPLDIVAVLQKHDQNNQIILLDCLTVWLGNLMHGQLNIKNEIDHLLSALLDLKSDIVFVASEVGLSIVPENAMARQFRDHAGELNQAIAAICNHVYFIAAGLPLKLKG